MKIKSTFILLLSLALLILIIDTSQAQVNSVLGRFSVDIDRGCNGTTVNITENGSFDTPNYWYEGFDESVPGSTDLFYTYNTPGQFYLTMVISDSPAPPEGLTDSLLITITEPLIPEFTIYNCDNHRVRVEINDDHYESYRIDFTATDSELVDPISFSSEFDYGAQGNYRIIVTGIVADGTDNCGTDSRVITTINEIVTPVITSLETTDNDLEGALQMVHTLGANTVYNLNSSTNSSEAFETLQSISGPQTDISMLNTVDNYYCYQIETYDACSEVIVPSNIACSVLFDVRSGEDGNLISWTTDTTQADTYNIIRDDNLLINVTPSNVTSYVDTAVICKRQYIYNVQPIFEGGSSIAIDTAVIANQSGDLPAITEYPESTVLDNQVVLDWGPPDTGDIPFNQYLIEKNINNRGWLSAGSTMDTTYTDRNASFIGAHSYRISYDDECGNTASGSPSTDPIIVQQVSARGRVVSYQWNKYETWLQGIRGYTMERVDTAGNVLEEYPVLSGRSKEITFDGNDLVDKYMRVRAESLDDIPLISYSNIILTSLSTEMYLPSGFTPDGDNLNDKFNAKGPTVYNFSMDIYNRWGILIFSTGDNLNGWDGQINGEDSPEDTYIYKIYFEDGEGRKYSQSGAFSLFRNP